MKNLFSWLTVAIVVLAVGCGESFDDSSIWNKLNEHSESIKDHEQRISALEELCKQMNTNISALQTLVEALQKNDYITSITPITKDGVEVGYTIAFAKSNPVTIYHGTNGKDGVDGADGKDGKDGYMPQIGVKQDVDGIYYWIVDGKWLLDENGNKIKAVGEDGKDGQDGVPGKDGEDGKDGQNGEDGKDGVDGKDGITPRLKIEEGYWYISYDEGTTWTELGKATGEDGTDGSDGQDGENADCIFRSITQDEAYVYFHLNDGTTIAIPKNGGSDENPGGDIPDGNNSIEHVTCADNEILYTTKYDYPIELAITDGFGATCQSNTYENGVGRIKFDYDVTVIPELAFMGQKSITQIKFPQTLKKIENRAFSGCVGLTSVTIPDSVTSIGGSAFLGCTGLMSVTIPSSVASIGQSAFSGCTGLTSVTIPDSVTSIGSFVFEGCFCTLTVNSRAIIEKDYEDAPSYWGSSTIILGDNIEKIGDSVFADSKITSITIPNSVTLIGDSAFRDCDGLTSITIPDSVIEIGGHAFSGCTDLTNITIPGSVTSIGEYTFSGCTGLTSVTIPDSVTSIGNYAFSDCDELKCILIPNSVVEIRDYVFSSCSNLTNIYCNSSTPPTLGELSFSEIPNNARIFVPYESYSEYKKQWVEYSDLIVPFDDLGRLSLMLTADFVEIVADGKSTVTFTVMQDGVAVNGAEVICTTGEKLLGNTFTTTTAGNYDFIATYAGSVSNTVTITATTNYVRHHAIMYFTGTWCPVCPNGLQTLKTIIREQSGEGTIHILSLHDGNSGNDIMGIPLTNTIVYDFGLWGYPSYVVDLAEGGTLGVEWSDLRAYLSAAKGMSAECGVALESNYNAKTRSVKVDVKVTSNYSKTYRVALYLLEDGIVHPQKYGSTMQNDYIHDHVVRMLLSSDYKGDLLGDATARQELKKSYTTNLDEGFVAENCTLCVMVIDDTTGFAVNAATCKLIDGSFDYDISEE